MGAAQLILDTGNARRRPPRYSVVFAPQRVATHRDANDNWRSAYFVQA